LKGDKEIGTFMSYSSTSYEISVGWLVCVLLFRKSRIRLMTRLPASRAKLSEVFLSFDVKVRIVFLNSTLPPPFKILSIAHPLYSFSL
jgi:hypothetical protein